MEKLTMKEGLARLKEKHNVEVLASLLLMNGLCSTGDRQVMICVYDEVIALAVYNMEGDMLDRFNIIKEKE